MLEPLLLTPDNFTEPSRTPWGGRRIVTRYKAALGLRAELFTTPVGESWELSLGPELPSRVEGGPLLREVIAQDSQAFLGAEAALGASALLVKWLDAADNLSVQIHPDVEDPELAPDETGKPECWYVVERDAGAGIYLGLLPGVSAAQMREAIEREQDVSRLLVFVPVEPGDFFLLSPGMPHAVGRGVTLIEPQYVAPGKKGVTLRYWDWNRRYDAQGRADSGGRPRELHLDRALQVTDWARSSDPAWLARQRCKPSALRLLASALGEPLCAASAAQVHSTHLRVTRLSGTGSFSLPAWDTLMALTVIEGEVLLHGEFGELRVPGGRTAAIPAALGGLPCTLRGAHAVLSSVLAATS